MAQFFAAFGIDWRLLLVQAVNFGLLLLALWYFLYGPVLKMIDDRRAKIAESVKVAEAAARRLEEAKAEGRIDNRQFKSITDWIVGNMIHREERT